jgi:GNAT superfamily N-acetyltransferase
MEITYTETIPLEDDFVQLFETTGWNRNYGLNPDELMQAVQHSWYAVSAYDRDRLVGFGRVISDTIMHALILDLIVLPMYRHKGIGGCLLEQLVDRCEQKGIRDIQLFCARGKIGFYEKRGFVRRPKDAPGMEIARWITGGSAHAVE